MVDLVLHPGHSKCGSTTIQDFIYANRQRFHNRGVFLPDVNFRFPCHKDYQFDLTQTPRDFLAKIQMGHLGIEELEKSLDDLIATAKDQKCRRVIISAENLINGIAGGITAQIHSLFAKKFNKVRIVYYIRRQDKLLLSAWQQWGHKEGLSFEEYAEKLIKTKFGDFLFIANKLKQAYPESVLKVYPIDKEFLVEKNLLVDFCTRSTIKKEGLNFDIASSNQGISSALCSTFSKINTIYASQHDQNIKENIISISDKSSHLIDKKYNNDFPQTLRNVLFEKFQDKNSRLAMRFFPKVPFEVLSLESFNKEELNQPLENLNLKVEKLEDLVSIQMDLILKLAKMIELNQ